MSSSSRIRFSRSSHPECRATRVGRFEGEAVGRRGDVSYISVTIRGVPYSQMKSRGDVDAPKRWSQAIIEQTRGLPCVVEACLVKITFLLPPDKFPNDLPYGPDLDNLLKRFMDALNETVFCEAKYSNPEVR